MFAKSTLVRWHERGLHPLRGWSGALPWILLTSAALAEPVNLDGFLNGLEKGCNLSKPLQSFQIELNARYSYEEGIRRLVKKVTVPPSVKAAVGPVKAVKHIEYTTILVPLVGIYRGLPTRSISFDIGHSNGIGVTTLTFGASASKVEKIIGSDVAHMMREFKADPEIKNFGFSAKILPRGKESALLCNTST